MEKPQSLRSIASLHKDETGAETLESILLITVALIVLTAIYAIANWAMKDSEKNQHRSRSAEEKAHLISEEALAE